MIQLWPPSLRSSMVLGLIVLVPLIRNHLGTGFSILAGSFVLGIMILPPLSASRRILFGLARIYKEGPCPSARLTGRPSGASCCCRPFGIVASVILGMGRALGETMAMIMILETRLRCPFHFKQRRR